ncbi:MAG: sensor histidine kinase [Solirubrobacteraceae bacterium]
MLEGIAIRWRLALLSAGLTLVILSAFAVVIGQVTSSRVRSDFNNELAAAVDNLSDRVTLICDIPAGKCAPGGPDLRDFSAAGNATIRILWPDGRILDRTPGAPNFGLIFPTRHTEYDGLRVEVRKRPVKVVDPNGHHSPVVVQMVLQYGRKVSDIEATIRRIRLFLSGGVLAGTLLALLGGVVLGRRAMLPVARMTTAARDIQRTRDPSKSIPQPAADDEVAELARTLQAMLDSLEAAQAETEGALQRQREFVADASHELRTPLTSILANLELLTEVLDGERGEAASSALRSSQRMRRLVGDLLLLARADANRQLPHEPTDVSHVLVEVAAELGPVSDGHHLTVDADDAVVDGTRDELYRMTLNLVENAIRHTPKGTRIRATVGRDNGEVVLVVQDDGPGVAPELRDHIFERFVRGAGDRGSSSGLGLSIVRAVAESHGGNVVLEDVHPGARFVVRLPGADVPAREPEPVA